MNGSWHRKLERMIYFLLWLWLQMESGKGSNRHRQTVQNERIASDAATPTMVLNLTKGCVRWLAAPQSRC